MKKGAHWAEHLAEKLAAEKGGLSVVTTAAVSAGTKVALRDALTAAWRVARSVETMGAHWAGSSAAQKAAVTVGLTAVTTAELLVGKKAALMEVPTVETKVVRSAAKWAAYSVVRSVAQ